MLRQFHDRGLFGLVPRKGGTYSIYFIEGWNSQSWDHYLKGCGLGIDSDVHSRDDNSCFIMGYSDE